LPEHLQVKALQSGQLALLATATVSAHLDTFSCFETLVGFSQNVQLSLGNFIWLLLSSVMCGLQTYAATSLITFKALLV